MVAHAPRFFGAISNFFSAHIDISKSMIVHFEVSTFDCFLTFPPCLQV